MTRKLQLNGRCTCMFEAFVFPAMFGFVQTSVDVMVYMFGLLPGIAGHVWDMCVKSF